MANFYSPSARSPQNDAAYAVLTARRLVVHARSLGISTLRAFLVRRLNGCVEIGLVCVILAFGGMGAARLLAPLQEISQSFDLNAEAKASHLPIWQNFGANPFTVAGTGALLQVATPLAESALNMNLHGTWQGPGGGTAALALGGDPQKLFAIGEEISPGVSLAAVHDEYVVISHQGVPEAVSIVNRLAPPRRVSEPKPAQNAAPTNLAVVTPPLAQPAQVTPVLRDATSAQLANADDARRAAEGVVSVSMDADLSDDDNAIAAGLNAPD